MRFGPGYRARHLRSHLLRRDDAGDVLDRTALARRRPGHDRAGRWRPAAAARQLARVVAAAAGLRGGACRAAIRATSIARARSSLADAESPGRVARRQGAVGRDPSRRTISGVRCTTVGSSSGRQGTSPPTQAAVDVFVAVYGLGRRRRRGNDLVQQRHLRHERKSLATEVHRKRRRWPTAIDARRCAKSMVLAANGERRVVWYWFVVGERPVARSSRPRRWRPIASSPAAPTPSESSRCRQPSGDWSAGKAASVRRSARCLRGAGFLSRGLPAMSVARTPLVAHVIYRLDFGGLENGSSTSSTACRGIATGTRSSASPASARSSVARIAARATSRSSAIGKRPGKDPAAYGRVWRTLRRLRPAIVHTRNLGTVDMQWVAWAAGCADGCTASTVGKRRIPQGRNPRSLRIRRACRPAIHRYVPMSRDLARWLERRRAGQAGEASGSCTTVSTPNDSRHPWQGGQPATGRSRSARSAGSIRSRTRRNCCAPARRSPHRTLRWVHASGC